MKITEEMVIELNNELKDMGCPFRYEYDENGYMYYDIIEKRNAGYYFVNGKMMEIQWVKVTATSPTKYYDMEGNEIALNVGKTYIGIVPSDTWEDIVIE